jgi:hypothetical protein
VKQVDEVVSARCRARFKGNQAFEIELQCQCATDDIRKNKIWILLLGGELIQNETAAPRERFEED